MGWFGFGKEDEVIDLGERYRKQQEKTAKVQGESNLTKSPVQEGFGFFGGLAQSIKKEEENNVPVSENTDDIEERKRKLAKRLAEITNRLEDLSNQLYHLQQRVELLERKAGVKI